MRREIQGLRAVAVLLVVLFHLWPEHVPGGYIGVDVFFVISGFLITSLLLREVDRDGSVSLARFWARRIRRLLPAAYVVLAASTVGVLTLVPRNEWQQFLGEILGAGLYVENWLLAFSSVDYLAADTPPSPAQHYWTLSAEEQFYVVWPLLVLAGLWLARRRRTPRRGVFAVLAVAVGASMAYSLWITATNPAWAYFVTPARAWEFGAGALLAFAPAATRLPAVARALLGWAGLVAVVAAAFVLDEGTPMPGTAAIWVVVASALLIWVGTPGLAWSSDRLLVLRPAGWVGDVSYAVYLWHWPLIILLPYATGHGLTTLDKLSVLMATIGLSAMTKRFVEDPVRAARRFGLARSRVTFGYAAVAAAVLAVVCLVPRYDVVREVERTQEVAAELAAEPPECFGAAARDPKNKDECPNPELEDTIVPAPEAALMDYPEDARCAVYLKADPIEPCPYGTRSEDKPHVAVVGDSHARVLMTSVARLVDDGKLTADQFVVAGCPWSTKPPSPQSPYAEGCTDFRAKFYPFLEDHATDYDAIITTARLTTMSGSREALVSGLSEAWTQATEQDVPVVVVRDNPTSRDGEGNPQSCLATVSVSRANAECALDRYERLDQWFDALSEAARRTPGAHLVDLTPYYCEEDTCPVVVGGVNVYRDNNHVTVTYARTLAPYLLRAIRATGVLRG